MKITKTSLWAAALLLPSLLPSFQAQAAPLQKRCFCVQETNNSQRPYEIWKFETEPGCAGMTYQAEGNNPSKDLFSCREMELCTKSLNYCKNKVAALSREMARVNKELPLCASQKCKDQLNKRMPGLIQEMPKALNQCLAENRRCGGSFAGLPAPEQPLPKNFYINKNDVTCRTPRFAQHGGQGGWQCPQSLPVGKN